VTAPNEIERIIEKAFVLRIALFDVPFPYLVPVSFGYCEGTFYFHSAPNGKKLDLIRQNNRVCFEAEADFGLIEGETPCRWSARYASVIGCGRAYFVADRETKKKGLEIIFRHYSAAPFTVPDEAVAQVAVIQIKVESITGKVSPKPEETDSK
jgi:hypothetical protein